MNRTYSFIANILVAITFTIVSLFLIGFLLVENGVFTNDIVVKSYEILDYDVTTKEDESSPTGIVKEYILDVGGIKEDEVTIAFFSKHQYSKVFVNGVLVCSVAPSDAKQFTNTMGCNWLMFNLTKEEATSEIIVQIIPVYKNVINSKIEFVKGSAFSIFYRIFTNSLPQIILGFLAIATGFVFLIVSFYRKVVNKECYTIFMLGLFSTFLGTWRLFDSEFIPFLLPQKPVFIYYVIVTMLTLCPIPFFNALKVQSTDLWKKIYNIFCIIVSIIAISQILLQIVYNVDVRKYLVAYHCFLGICLIVVFIGEIYHKIKGFKRISLIHENLPIICVVAVILDLGLYYLSEETAYLFFTISFFLFYIVVTGILMIRHYAVLERTLKDELKQSQISILLSQIQPHFIYNTLSSIRYLCKSDAELAQKSIDDFALYLRCNMDSLQKSDLIPFEKELLFIETYVKLEQLRFGDRIKVVYDFEETNFDVPSLTLQPLVENAIKHGISLKENGGTVTLKTERVDNDILISIIDDGIGFDVDKQLDDGRTHIGLPNVKHRLSYFMDSEFNVESSSLGTTIKILLKNIKKEKK